MYINRFRFEEPAKQTNDIEVTITEEVETDSNETNAADFLQALSADDVTTVRRMLSSKIFDVNHRFEVSLRNFLRISFVLVNTENDVTSHV